MLLYAKEAKNAQTIARYGGGAPSDWLERHVYTAFPGLGMRYPAEQTLETIVVMCQISLD